MTYGERLLWYNMHMPKRSVSYIHEYPLPGSVWVHVERNTEKEMRQLDELYGYHPVDLEETLPPLQRPKVVVRDGYVFMILLFPVFNPKSRIVSTAEVDFFISKDRLVTVCGADLPAFKAVSEVVTRQSKKNKPADTAHILHLLLETLLESLFPMLVHLSQDIDEVEKSLFLSDQRGVIMELLRIKTNIVNVRKAMQGHKKVIRGLVSAGQNILPIKRMEVYYDQLVDHTKEIWDTLEVQRETINALHETHVSLIDSRTNNNIKTLTALSAIILPLTLVAQLFAIGYIGEPWRNDPLGFIKIVALLTFLALGLWGFFKYKKLI